jgi:hypothetical protein
MKCGILRGNDYHTYRLSQGLMACGIKVEYLTGTKVAPNTYDIVFVDPSYSESVQKDIGKRVLFFDCEDDPRHFDPGPAYESLKDHVDFYAKLVYVEDDRGDGIKNIAFPIVNFLQLADFAKNDFSEIPYSFSPIFVGVPTWYTCVSELRKGSYGYDEEQDIKSLIRLPKEKIGLDGHQISYNQRVDWFLSMEKKGTPVRGGLVFKEEEECYSEDYIANLFGEGVRKWKHPPISYQQNLISLLQNKIALCPTGHDRISWRTFDIMATGSILFWTEVEDRKMLYMPQFHVEVKDGEDIGTKIANLESDFEKLLEESQANREVLKSLTPKKVREDFLKQVD